MNKRWKVCIVLLLLPLVLTGCWSRRELNQLGIAVGMGIDKIGDEYRITAQLVNPQAVVSTKGGASKTGPVTTYQADGKNVFEAMRRMTTTSPRRIYVSHLRLLVISEEFARQGIAPILDVLTRDHAMRSDFYLVIAKGQRAEEVLNVFTMMEVIPANGLHIKLESSEKAWAPTVTVQMDELISKISGKGTQAVMTGVRVEGDPKKGGQLKEIQRISPVANPKYVGIAAFRGDRLVGWLNEDESKGFNYIRGIVKSTVGHVPCRGGSIALELAYMKSEIQGMVENGQPKIRLHVYVESNIQDVACRMDPTQESEFHAIEEQATISMRKLLIQTIQTAQKKMNADIFSFGQAIHRADPKAWKKLQDRWGELFPTLPVDVQVQVKIRRIGTIGQSVQNIVREE